MNNIDIVITSASANNFAKIEMQYSVGSDNFSAIIDNKYFDTFFSYTNETDSIAFDFYLISIVVYNIDKILSRRKYSTDGWLRNIRFSLPVNTPHIWTAHKVEIEHILSFLTGDIWQIEFLNSNDIVWFNETNNIESDFQPDKICLFSGGLDSLIGAINLLENNSKTLLISHYDGGLKGPLTDQSNLYNEIESHYQDLSRRLFNRVGLQKGSYNFELEKTFRSRSILFISMAAYLAHTLTPDIEFVLPENGTISLNIPLSASRRSTCSTRTTHPYLLTKINELFAKVGIKTKVVNPFEYMTKGEMLLPYNQNEFIKSLMQKSNSCAKSGHKRWWSYKGEGQRHCGKCMPCFYRRAALNKIGLDNITYYGDNLFDSNDCDFTKGRWNDAKTLLNFISSNKDRSEIAKELLINGSIENDKLNDYVDVICRTIDELKQWIVDNSNRSNYAEIRRRANL